MNSNGKLDILYLTFQKTYGHQTRKYKNLSEPYTFKGIWLFYHMTIWQKGQMWGHVTRWKNIPSTNARLTVTRLAEFGCWVLVWVSQRKFVFEFLNCLRETKYEIWLKESNQESSVKQYDFSRIKGVSYKLNNLYIAH